MPAFHNLPSVFARALYLRGMVDSEKQTIIIADGYTTARKLGKHFSDIAGWHPKVVDHPSTYKELLTGEANVFLATLDLFHQSLPSEKDQASWVRHFKIGDMIETEELVQWLLDHGYSHQKEDLPYSYRIDGDTIQISSPGHQARISLFGPNIDGIYTSELESDFQEANEIQITAHFPRHMDQQWHLQKDFDLELGDLRSDSDWIFLGVDFSEHRQELEDTFVDALFIHDLPSPASDPLPYDTLHIHDLQELKDTLLSQMVCIYTKRPDVIEKFFKENEIHDIQAHHLRLSPGESFSWSGSGIMESPEDAGGLVLSDDILGKLFVKKRSKLTKKQRLDLLIHIKTGDYVVHLYHGVGRFHQYTKKDLSGVIREYLEVHYAGDDKLFIPVEEVHRISKYIGQGEPTLTKLGKLEWKKTLAKTQKEIEDIAEDLLKNHANRQLAAGFSFLPFPEQEEKFVEAFGHVHTPDQWEAIEDIRTDMGKPVAMDRLLSGDVGFGKTEVAMHAIYRSFLNAKQTLLLSPLVVLAYEHFETCKERLEPFGIKVDILTRLSTTKEVKKVLEDLKNGHVDVVVGTHRLLSPDVDCEHLGLIIVDEEHKFGVKDKERIITIKDGVDTLALSATPIPRSLNLALSGVKQFSILSTAPTGKQPISTLVTQYEPDTIKRAIKDELDRDGKVFYIYNRVETIASMKHTLEKIVGPRAKIVITHGQMDGVSLEDNIMDFKAGKYNILLTTTVIENGINFLDTNTIIIHDAQQFGLAQLHQLRGRVGRGKIHGFCYLMYGRQDIPDDAKERLITIANNTHLGAGFEIAMRDMEMRGVGEVLGVKQSGKTKDVGISFYLKLLEQKIEELKEGRPAMAHDCSIELGLSYFVPDEYFTSDMDKVHFYRHLQSLDSIEQIDDLYETTILEHDAAAPIELENLFLLARARVILRGLGVKRVKKQVGQYVFIFDDSATQEQVRAFLARDTDRHVVLASIHKAQIREGLMASPIALLEYIT